MNKLNWWQSALAAANAVPTYPLQSEQAGEQTNTQQRIETAAFLNKVPAVPMVPTKNESRNNPIAKEPIKNLVLEYHLSNNKGGVVIDPTGDSLFATIQDLIQRFGNRLDIKHLLQTLEAKHANEDKEAAQQLLEQVLVDQLSEQQAESWGYGGYEK